jgi:hypothetical protein
VDILIKDDVTVILLLDVYEETERVTDEETERVTDEETERVTDEETERVTD